MKTIALKEEVIIRNVKKVWEEIKSAKGKLEIDCSSMKKFDGAGFQLLMFLSAIECELTGLTEDMKKQMESFGYSEGGFKE